MGENIRFISCDWGTSSLRLHLVDCATQTILEKIKTNEGIAPVHQLWKQEESANRFAFYYAVLQKHIHKWENAPMLISGMASSSIGIEELPYTSFPYNADGSGLFIKSYPKAMHIISGACTPDDVMRGEETLLAGCPGISNGLYIFPGTHSKHIKVKNGLAVGLATYMTGEFFDLLSRHSVLAGSAKDDEKSYPEFFAKGIVTGAKQSVLKTAFNVRVNQLFKKAGVAENYQYLSGLLIGAELGELAPDDPSNITVVAEKNLLEKYLKGLAILQPHRLVDAVDAGRALLNGHFQIFSKLYHD